MSEPSMIRLERTTLRTARITFTNPPVNLVIPESVVTLHKIVKELENDPDIQVVVFSSELPDFSINHYDGAAADLPQPEHEDDNPVWTDMVLRLSKAPFNSIAVIRGHPGPVASHGFGDTAVGFRDNDGPDAPLHSQFGPQTRDAVLDGAHQTSTAKESAACHSCTTTPPTTHPKS
jgi:hypothetical protein